MSASRIRPAAALSEARRGYALLVLTALVWGLNWTVVKFLLTELPPFTLRALAALIGAALLFTISAARGERIVPPAAHWVRLALSATLNFAAWMGLASLSLEWLPAGEAAIIAFTLPLWTILFAWPLLGERPTRGRLAGLVLGLAGVIVLMANGPLGVAWRLAPGFAAILGASLSFALGTVLAKRLPAAVPPVASVAWQLVIAAILLGALGLATERTHLFALSLLGLAALGYLALIAMSLAYVSWFGAVRRLPAGTVTIGLLLVPVWGVVAAAILLGEPIGGRQVIALALTLSGVLLASRG